MEPCERGGWVVGSSPDSGGSAFGEDGTFAGGAAVVSSTFTAARCQLAEGVQVRIEIAEHDSNSRPLHSTWTSPGSGYRLFWRGDITRGDLLEFSRCGVGWAPAEPTPPAIVVSLPLWEDGEGGWQMIATDDTPLVSASSLLGAGRWPFASCAMDKSRLVATVVKSVGNVFQAMTSWVPTGVEISASDACADGAIVRCALDLVVTEDVVMVPGQARGRLELEHGQGLVSRQLTKTGAHRELLTSVTPPGPGVGTRLVEFLPPEAFADPDELQRIGSTASCGPVDIEAPSFRARGSVLWHALGEAERGHLPVHLRYGRLDGRPSYGDGAANESLSVVTRIASPLVLTVRDAVVMPIGIPRMLGFGWPEVDPPSERRAWVGWVRSLQGDVLGGRWQGPVLEAYFPTAPSSDLPTAAALTGVTTWACAIAVLIAVVVQRRAKPKKD
mmetsp:Transcript_94914/g.217372  ORF Transcript_94914/g.217372 Transcript_94914/m.217372 type:complete len:443 (+) Transcript_94914:2-1330(+)